MKLASILAGSDELRLVTQPTAGPGFVYNPPETWLIKAADRHLAPAALLNASEPVSIEQRTPHTKIFDPVEFANATRPRVEPRPIRDLTEADILRRFSWTPKQFQTARAELGFPRYTGMHDNPRPLNPGEALWGDGITAHYVWSELVVQNWELAARSLHLPSVA